MLIDRRWMFGCTALAGLLAPLPGEGNPIDADACSARCTVKFIVLPAAGNRTGR